jgi:hypothetical protein
MCQGGVPGNHSGTYFALRHLWQKNKAAAADQKHLYAGIAAWPMPHAVAHSEAVMEVGKSLCPDGLPEYVHCRGAASKRR